QALCGRDVQSAVRVHRGDHGHADRAERAWREVRLVRHSTTVPRSTRLRYAAHAPVRNGLPAGVSPTLRIMSAAPHSHGLHADVSVRPSIPESTVHLGRIRVAAWQKAFAVLHPDAVLAGLSNHTLAEHRRVASASPPHGK